ncbi:MAG: hypothetical protein KDB03_09935 [Planctomycetales bacterium]|nr:hypothetical protein [Planctomycetales bacterium]
MKIFIGVDEAGYGPNLGPLTIAASVWWASERMSESDLTQRLKACFHCQPWKNGCNYLPLGDSKQLYQSTRGLINLEAGLLPLMWHTDQSASDLQKLIEVAFTNFDSKQIAPPWYNGWEIVPVPCNLPKDEIIRLGRLAASFEEEEQIGLSEISFSIVSEQEFNLAVSRSNSKGIVLSERTLQLVASLVEKYSEHEIEVYCDRQGGRTNYLPLLLEAMSDVWFTEVISSPSRCTYKSSTDINLTIHFSVGGDSFAPTALASMCAKYVRERIMECFNRFWNQHLPEIRPTAGYPVDAKRFRQEIEQKAVELGLPLDSWWRSR